MIGAHCGHRFAFAGMGASKKCEPRARRFRDTPVAVLLCETSPAFRVVRRASEATSALEGSEGGLDAAKAGSSDPFRSALRVAPGYPGFGSARLADNNKDMRGLCFILMSMVLAAPAVALETDQFTVPPKPLADYGPKLSQRVADEIRVVVDDANATRAKELREAAKARSRGSQRAHLEKAYAVVSQPVLAKAIYDAISGGNPYENHVESWVRNRANETDDALELNVGQSIYGPNPFERPIALSFLAGTVRLHGEYVGTDKVGHFGQQGYEYYEQYLAARLAGKDEAEATQVAVAYGVAQEKGWFGEMICGIYSNADLAANYSGLLFYRNVMEPIYLGDVTLPPMIVWDGDKLKLSPQVNSELLKPFITDHWNEAKNPCRYNGYWRPYMRERIAAHVDAWMTFNHSTPAAETERLKHIDTFYGHDYGHSDWRDVITLVNAGQRDVVASN